MRNVLKRVFCKISVRLFWVNFSVRLFLGGCSHFDWLLENLDWLWLGLFGFFRAYLIFVKSFQPTLPNLSYPHPNSTPTPKQHPNTPSLGTLSASGRTPVCLRRKFGFCTTHLSTSNQQSMHTSVALFVNQLLTSPPPEKQPTE